ncbi:MAG: FliG C-terminal domain-containing protein [Elusimicrobiota bacterium]
MFRKLFSFLVIAPFVFVGLIYSIDVSWDSERLNLEVRMQQRVEEVLSKILSPDQFVVVVRIEPLVSSPNTVVQDESDGFFLPGVPNRSSLNETSQQVKSLVDTLKTEDKFFKKFIKRISVTLVLDESLPEVEVGKVRELTRQILGLDPERGDSLNIQKSKFNKSATPIVNNSPMNRIQTELKNYWVVVVLILTIFCVFVCLLFMFGPLRGFLNNLIQILPTLKPEDSGRNRADPFPLIPPYFPPSYGLPNGGNGGGNTNFSGALQVENPNKTTLPFGFIREDNISNLAVILSKESPEKAAVVLGYLPADWIIRVMSKISPTLQSEITSKLATTRQLLPEQVEDIEQDLKRRLDYMIGGPERMFSVYESLDPEAQRNMLENLKESSPEIAEEMRQRSFLFEDLDKFEVSSLKAILREVDLQTLILSLRASDELFVNKILEHVPEGKAEIIRDELSFKTENLTPKIITDAQRKISLIAKRLKAEGHIHIPEVKSFSPAERLAGSLRHSLKLPAGMKFEESLSVDSASRPGNDIENKISNFLKKRTDQERFPVQDGEFSREKDSKNVGEG